MEASLLNALQSAIGAAYVRDSAEDLAVYGRDRTSFWDVSPSVVVLPADTAQVQALIRIANEFRVPVVPSGGRTGLSGGAVASHGEIVLSLQRMDRVRSFNEVDRTVTVEAGVITANLQQFALSRGLYYPVDFASSGSSQIGGNIATNAGGIKVIRYGMTREQIVGLEVVTGGGEILDLNRGLIKNNSGLDLRHLMIGSEGILGVITAATVRLDTIPPQASVMVIGAHDFDAVITLLRAFNGAIALRAFEFFSHNALERLVKERNLQAPLDEPTAFYALLEFDTAEADDAMRVFAELAEQGSAVDAVMSQNLAQAASLWRLREEISETLSRHRPYKNDISVRIADMAAFIAEVDALVVDQLGSLEVVWYGHIGDGNLHLNILPDPEQPQATFMTSCKRFSNALAVLLQRFGGSISAEHGVGLLKKEQLWSTRSAAEIALMRQIKRAFDPNGILNPGKVFDL